MNNLSTENMILLDLLANSLFNAEIKISLDNMDPRTLFNEASSQTVLALAFDALPQEAQSLNPEVYDKWQKHSFRIIQKNMCQMASNAKLEEIFDCAKLPFCTIKGFASAYYYGDKMHLRQMGDIDFIVPDEKMETSIALLKEKGYEPADNTEDHDFHFAFTKNNELYEMHKGITSILDENGYIEKYTADIFAGSVKADFGAVNITIPDIFTHGLVMLLHMQRHMLTGGGVGLRHLCDWATFVDSIEDSEWESVFEDKLKKVSLWKFAQALSKLSNVYLKIKEKEWFSDTDQAITDNLLADIILGGNFGRKDIKRYQEILFVSQKNEDKNKFKFYFNGLISKVYSWKPYFRHHRALVPLGVVAYIFRTSFLVIFCRKKINLYETRKSGTHRNSLYKDLFK